MTVNLNDAISAYLGAARGDGPGGLDPRDRVIQAYQDILRMPI